MRLSVIAHVHTTYSHHKDGFNNIEMLQLHFILILVHLIQICEASDSAVSLYFASYVRFDRYKNNLVRVTFLTSRSGTAVDLRIRLLLTFYIVFSLSLSYVHSMKINLKRYLSKYPLALTHFFSIHFLKFDWKTYSIWICSIWVIWYYFYFVFCFLPWLVKI